MALIFVYGTLMRGGENHRHLDRQRFVGEARTQPIYRLYELDGYPGLVPAPAEAHGAGGTPAEANGAGGTPAEANGEGGGAAIEGEVWEVDADCLRRLDALEGTHAGLYRRSAVRLGASSPAAGAVETYFYNQSIEGRRLLGRRFNPAPDHPESHAPIGAHAKPAAPHHPPASDAPSGAGDFTD